MGIKRLFFLSLIVLSGATTGAAVALWQTGQANTGDKRPGAVIDGMWTSDLDIGSINAKGLLRARIARKGLFALSKQEAVYYIRTVDDSGARLRPECRYDVSGTQPPADWWSITLYGEDDFLLRNRDNAASINALDPAFSGPSWRVRVASTRPQTDLPWLSSSGARSYDLMLRLYGPDLETLARSDFRGFPSIKRLDCGQDPA